MQRSFLGFHRQVLPPVTNYLLGWLLPTKKNSMLKYHTMKTQPDQMQLNSFFTFSIQMLTPFQFQSHAVQSLSPIRILLPKLIYREGFLPMRWTQQIFLLKQGILARCDSHSNKFFSKKKKKKQSS